MLMTSKILSYLSVCDKIFMKIRPVKLLTDRQTDRQTNRQTDKQINDGITFLAEVKCSRQLPGHCVAHRDSAVFVSTLDAQTQVKHLNHAKCFTKLSNVRWRAIYSLMCVSYTSTSQTAPQTLWLCWHLQVAHVLSLIHIWRCRRSTLCRSRWSPYH